MTQVSVSFIEDALYERFNAVKDNRWKAIHEKAIDQLVELIADCGTNAPSASHVIDNWLINWESGDYADIREYYLKEESEYTGEEEQIEKIHEYCEENYYFFDDDLEEYCEM